MTIDTMAASTSTSMKAPPRAQSSRLVAPRARKRTIVTGPGNTARCTPPLMRASPPPRQLPSQPTITRNKPRKGSPLRVITATPTIVSNLPASSPSSLQSSSQSSTQSSQPSLLSSPGPSTPVASTFQLTICTSSAMVSTITQPEDASWTSYTAWHHTNMSSSPSDSMSTFSSRATIQRRRSAPPKRRAQPVVELNDQPVYTRDLIGVYPQSPQPEPDVENWNVCAECGWLKVKGWDRVGKGYVEKCPCGSSKPPPMRGFPVGRKGAI